MMHSRNFFTFLVLGGLLLPAGSHALSFGIGPKGGINLANADVEGHSKTDGRTGLALGAVAEFGVTTPYSLVVEPLYIQRGASYKYGSSVTAKGEFDYFEIPVLLKAKFGAIRHHAYLFVGPSIGINTAAEGTLSGALGTISPELKNSASSVTWSAEGGAGGALQLSQFVYLQADARYTYGLSNALDETVGDVESWKARDIRLMVGLLFHLTE